MSTPQPEPPQWEEEGENELSEVDAYNEEDADGETDSEADVRKQDQGEGTRPVARLTPPPSSDQIAVPTSCELKVSKSEGPIGTRSILPRPKTRLRSRTGEAKEAKAPGIKHVYTQPNNTHPSQGGLATAHSPTRTTFIRHGREQVPPREEKRGRKNIAAESRQSPDARAERAEQARPGDGRSRAPKKAKKVLPESGRNRPERLKRKLSIVTDESGYARVQSSAKPQSHTPLIPPPHTYGSRSHTSSPTSKRPSLPPYTSTSPSLSSLHNHRGPTRLHVPSKSQSHPVFHHSRHQSRVQYQPIIAINPPYHATQPVVIDGLAPPPRSLHRKHIIHPPPIYRNAHSAHHQPIPLSRHTTGPEIVVGHKYYPEGVMGVFAGNTGTAAISDIQQSSSAQTSHAPSHHHHRRKNNVRTASITSSSYGDTSEALDLFIRSPFPTPLTAHNTESLRPGKFSWDRPYLPRLDLSHLKPTEEYGSKPTVVLPPFSTLLYPPMAKISGITDVRSLIGQDSR